MGRHIGMGKEFKHLKDKIKDKASPEKLDQGPDTIHVNGPVGIFSYNHIGEDDTGDTGHTGREEKDDRHKRGCPHGIGLDAAKDKADVSVQGTGHGYADGSQKGGDLVINPQGFR